MNQLDLTHKPAPFRGPTSSQDYNEQSLSIIEGLHSLQRQQNTLQAEMERWKQIASAENADMKARLALLDRRRAFEDLVLARSSGTITAVQDFRDLSKVMYGSLVDGRRLRIDPRYGQAVLPYNRVVHRFFTPSLELDEVTVVSGATVDVVSVSEGGSASRIIQGTPKNVINGHNQSYWHRQVELPLESDVTEVTCRMLIEVPNTYVDLANVMAIHPFPLDSVDITGIWYSTGTADPDPTDPNDLLPGFPTSGLNSATHYRLFFEPMGITKLLIEFRQRNWREREGKKLFEYGAQEVSLQLVDFDKTSAASANAPVTSANGLITVFECPDGYYFKGLVGFFGSPDWDTPTGSAQEIYHRIYTDENLTNEIWNSYSDSLPQDVSVSLTATNTSKLYVLSTMNYDSSNSVTPVLEYVGIQYTTKAS